MTTIDLDLNAYICSSKHHLKIRILSRYNQNIERFSNEATLKQKQGRNFVIFPVFASHSFADFVVLRLIFWPFNSFHWHHRYHHRRCRCPCRHSTWVVSLHCGGNLFVVLSLQIETEGYCTNPLKHVAKLFQVLYFPRTFLVASRATSLAATAESRSNKLRQGSRRHSQKYHYLQNESECINGNE